MYNLLRKLIKRQPKAEQARDALMQKVREVTRQGSCVILSESKDGTRVIVIGKPLVISQAEEILRMKGEDNG